MSQSRTGQPQKNSTSRRRRLSLRSRLVLFVLLVSLIPLIIIATRDTLQTQQVLKRSAEVSLRSGAEQTANSMDAFIQLTLDSIAAEARFSDFTTYLTLSPAAPITQARAQDLLNKLRDKSSKFIISYALVDTNGVVLLDTVGFNVKNDESGEAYYPQVQSSDTPVVTVVTYSEDNIPSITFASKVTNINGDHLGILRVKYNSDILQDVIIRSVESTATDVSVLLLDPLHIRMADSRHPELVLKSIVPLEVGDYLLAVKSRRFLDNPTEKQYTYYPDFELALDNAAKQPFFTTDITPDEEGDDTIAVAFMQTQPWIVTYSRPTSHFLADVQQQTRVNIILILAASILITTIAALVVRNLTRPIISLTKTANAISQGDLSARAEVNTADEIGSLADTFNKMSSQIQELVTDLEQRVEQRTAELEQRTTELEQITRQSEKRANQLQTITELAGHISTEKDVENLLSLITKTVSERFGYYHVGIFLLSENGKFAVLRAANSPGGQKMLERQHKLEVGQVGIVGRVTATGFPRIALDTGSDAVFFNNPDLPDTHSEMALPLTARGQIIGALDVQSTAPNAFTDADVSILSLLADQIAIAIDNVRLLEEAHNALEESQTVLREYLADAWQKKSTSEIMGYYQTATGGQLITARESRKVRVFDEAEAETLSMPIKMRGQVIGALNIRPNTGGRDWTKDEVDIIQAVSERLGLALDNARLFEETSSRASRERLVAEITTRIRSTTDPEEMVKTAVEELQRALGASRVEILPQKTVASQNK